MTNCETHMAHCTSCGSYALRDVSTDTGFRHTSACCSAPVSKGACSENHPPYVPAGRKQREKLVLDPPKARGSHADCDHPSTSAARRACRKARA